ncbi:MAG: hypothetical protein R6V06_00025 [Kiritimatiellia bacterium]
MLKTTLTQIRGITLLALQASTRTRVVLLLVLLQVICVFMLPRAVEGDGTPAGDLEILLTYTLGLSFAVQALATMWASCSLFAGEISSLRIQMTVVKPAGFVVLWLGRWFALLLLNAALLVIVYVLVYLQVRMAEYRGGWARDVIPASQHLSRPVLPSTEESARLLLEQMKKAGTIPEGMSEEEVLDTLEEQESERYDIINPGDEISLNFALKRPVEKDDEITLRLEFDTEYSTRENVRGVVRLAEKGNPGNYQEKTLDSVTQNELFLKFKASDFISRSKTGKPLRSFDLTFFYNSRDEKASALMLRLRQDIVLLLPGGSFEMNLVRSAFLQGCVLAVLAAFGLALSACFSFPVASFAATAVLALVMMAGGVLPMVSKEDEKVWSTRVGVKVLRSVRYVTKHAVGASPLTSVARGERIRRDTMLITAFWSLGLMPLVMAVLACAVLRRREVADA